MYILKRSIAARLVLGYAILQIVSVAIVSAVFYFGTVGVLDRTIDKKIILISDRLLNIYKTKSQQGLYAEINSLLMDGIKSDTEIFLLLDPSGRPIIGNISALSNSYHLYNVLINRKVIRYGRSVPARLIIYPLQNGSELLVGWNLDDRESIGQLVWKALAIGTGGSLFLAIVGALVFRRQLGSRIDEIRHLASEIGEGNLSRRVSIISEDEFGLLNHDINRMLDRIEHLMEGVRHVSNAIAHDLRTPLSRIRTKLENALHHESAVNRLSGVAEDAIADIDELIRVFDKLLQIAEAESGMRPQSFGKINLSQIVCDIVELYDAIAEEKNVVIEAVGQNNVSALGDKNLLGNALASLIDNAVKYGGEGATVRVGAFYEDDSTVIMVHDNGPGIPEEEISNVTQRFYRVDQSRNLPGNGLGLSIVSAIVLMHGGSLKLQNAYPGLIAKIALPNLLST
jgi:signal transduction histidine kinase